MLRFRIVFVLLRMEFTSRKLLALQFFIVSICCYTYTGIFGGCDLSDFFDRTTFRGSEDIYLGGPRKSSCRIKSVG